jgi:chromosome segregation ATPase
MPNSKDGQKRITALEMNYVKMQEKLENIEEKMTEIGKKLDNLTATLDPWKMKAHDCELRMNQLEARLVKIEQNDGEKGKRIERIDDTVKNAKAYLAGALFVIAALFTVVQYIMDKFIK